jgi:hypothetical protein
LPGQAKNTDIEVSEKWWEKINGKIE